MAVPERKITLAGKERIVRYGYRAFRRAKDKGYNLPLVGMVSLGVGDILPLIWVGLLHENPDITEDEVADLIDETDDLGPVITAVMEAAGEFLSSMVGNGKKGQPKKKKAARSTSKASSE